MAKFKWHRLLEKAWLYTKIFFAVLTLCVISYAYGTYNPNKSAIAEVNAELDLFYMQKIEEMGFKVGEDFFMIYSPEREDPGNSNFNTQNIPKVVGADNYFSKKLIL